MRSRRNSQSASPLLLELVRGLERALGRRLVTKTARPRNDLVRDFRAELSRRGCGAKYVRETIRYLNRLLPLEPVEEVSSADLTRAIESSIGGRTSKAHARQALFSFFDWCVGGGELFVNPVDGVPAIDKKPVREPRRSLAEDELLKLLESENLLPLYRTTFYTSAIGIGLRCSALGRLAWAQADLDQSFVRYLKKSGHWSLKHLPPIVVRALRRWKAHLEAKDPELVTPEAKIFARKIPTRRTFYEDLEKVGIKRVTADGRLDRHALRVTFGTRLLDVSDPFLAKEGLDHVDLRTTLRYIRRPADRLRDAIDRAAPKPSEEEPSRTWPK